MIQDISPKKLNNAYIDKNVHGEARIIFFYKREVMVKRQTGEGLQLPCYGELQEEWKKKQYQFLFAIDQDEYFLYIGEEKEELPAYQYEPIQQMRQLVSKDICFGIMTAWQLKVWYSSNRYCGKCGHTTQHDHVERMLRCPECGNLIYPKIAPAVIVCLTDGDRILMTKYAGREYKKYALLAGFVEIGETAEETVAREVMEEVGLQVNNIRYYKSQPWGVDSNLLLGYFCELAGDDTIHMDEEELAQAQWYHRNEMPAHDDGISLTREMMDVFEHLI